MIQETQGKVQDPAPSCTDHTMVDPVPHEPVQFDWAADVNADMGLSPITSAPTHPNHALPQHTITLSNDDMPLCPCTPTTGAPTDCTPIGYTPAPPTVHGPRDLSGFCSGLQNLWGSLACHRQHSYPPHNLSLLHSNRSNPWSSLCSHKRHLYTAHSHYTHPQP